MPGRSGKTRTMNPIGPVWRFTVRDTDGLQTTVTLGPVNRAGQDSRLELDAAITLPMPDQDEHLPDQDRGRRPSRRAGGPATALPGPDREGRPGVGPPAPPRQGRRRHPAAGDAPLHLQDHLRRGHRPAVAGSATITTARSRSPRRRPGARPTNWPSPGISATRSAIRWANTPRGQSLAEIGAAGRRRGPAGPQHDHRDRASRKASRLIAAQRERARSILAGASEAQLALLGPCRPPTPTP